MSVRRLAVITGLGPTSGGSVQTVLDGLQASGWRLLRRPRLGAMVLDHVVLGPGGVFLVLVRRGGGRVRPEWADEARALAAMLARVTRRAVTPLVVLERCADWSEARRFHGVDITPVGGLARYLVASGHAISPTDVEALHDALRVALAA